MSFEYLNRELTEKELKIIALVTEGLTNREIGEVIGVTENVVKNYLRPIYDKLGMWTRLELALWAVSREKPHEIPK